MTKNPPAALRGYDNAKLPQVDCESALIRTLPQSRGLNMAFKKRLESRSADAQRCRARHDKVETLQALKTVDARKQLKAMRDVWYDTDKAGTAGEFWDPKGKNKAKGSSGKCDRINRGHTAKLNQAKGL